QEGAVARPLPSLPRGTVRHRALVTLSRETLLSIATLGGLVLAGDEAAGDVHWKVLESNIGLESILIPLSHPELVGVALALELDASGLSSEVIALILALAANEHDVEKVGPSGGSGRHAWEPPGRSGASSKARPPKAPTGTVIERVLGTLNHTVLNRLVGLA